MKDNQIFVLNVVSFKHPSTGCPNISPNIKLHEKDQIQYGIRLRASIMKGSKKCSSFNSNKKSHPGSSSFSNYDGKEVVVEQFGMVDLQVNYKDPIKCEKENSKEGNLSKKFNLSPST